MMGHHGTESAGDRTRRHRAQAEAREQELAAQAEELQQEGRSQVRAWKARAAAEADTGPEAGDPRAQKEYGHQPLVEETGSMGTTSRDASDPARDTGEARNTGDLARRLGELARIMQEEDDFEATLAAMVAAALQLIPGAVAAVISVAEHRRAITSHAASSDLPAPVDRLQEEHGKGPGLDAAHGEKIVRVLDFRQENRWPSFAPAAAEAGVTSMLAFQLYTDGDNLGALNVYGSEAGVFTAETEEIGALVAAHAAVAFADAPQIKHLTEALATRDVTGQAKGILMERYRITAQQAFVVLTTVSSRTHIKLRDVAQQLATTGTLPDTTP